ncbi:hypothetical protein Bbelb_281330 [Branchiostoma belcheri]|nr:hypothetical protein Bbelb_281330 [Branchiostoma belcheri]
MQNRVGKLILKAPYRTPSREVLSRLGWKSVRTLHRQHKAMLVYRALDNSLPPHMRGVFIRYRDEASRSTRQSTLDNLIIPRPQLEVYRRSLRYSGATVWNSLPPHVRAAQSLGTFRMSCPSGTFWKDTTGGPKCVDFPVGTYQTETGQKVCSDCPNKTNTTEAGVKREEDCHDVCPPGTFSDTGLGQNCRPCRRGFYQPLAGQTSCLWCPKNTNTTGKYQGSRELSPKKLDESCKARQAERTYMYTFVGNTAPSRQHAQQPATDKTDLDICQAGTASADNSTMCVPCAAGEFSSTPGAGTCQKCPAGKYSTGAGSKSCSDCPAGKYSKAEGSTGCKACPAGQYSERAGSSNCTDCPAGQYSDAAESSACKACPAGQYSISVGSSNCTDCPAGQYSDTAESTACKACPAGRYSSIAGSNNCTDCPAGKYSETEGSTGCKACPAGQYSSAAGSTGCMTCPPGQYSSRVGSNNCTDCPAGRYIDTAESTCCKACPAGQYSSNAGSSGCMDCPAGNYSKTGSAVCPPCPAGQYSSGPRSTRCMDCPLEIFTSTAGSTGCKVCRYGETVNAAGRSACKGTQRTAPVRKGQTTYLTCEFGLEIQVQHVITGGASGKCKPFKKGCDSPSGLSKFKNSCKGRLKCSVQASGVLFGERCSRKARCLQATFTCIGSIGPTAGRIARRPQAGGRSDSREGRDRGRCGIHPVEGFDNGFRTGPYRKVQPGPEPVIERYRGPGMI